MFRNGSGAVMESHHLSILHIPNVLLHCTGSTRSTGSTGSTVSAVSAETTKSSLHVSWKCSYQFFVQLLLFQKSRVLAIIPPDPVCYLNPTSPFTILSHFIVHILNSYFACISNLYSILLRTDKYYTVSVPKMLCIITMAVTCHVHVCISPF